MAENEMPIKRILPQDRNAERSIIGSMLMDPDAISDVSGILVKEDFFDPQYAVLFEAICSLHEQGRVVDEVILADRLRAMGAPETLYRLDFLGDILAEQQTSVHAVEYARIVKDKAMLRNMIRVADSISKDCYEAKGSTDDLLNQAEEAVFKLVQQRSGSREFASMQSIVVEVISQIEQAARNAGKVNGLPTGFIDLDRRLTGMHEGELILVAARPAMGKTAFVLNIAHSVLKKQNVPVVIFSLEMSKESLVNRLLSIDSGVDAQNVRTGQLKEEEWDRLIESTEVVARMPLVIEDNSNVTIPELRSKCRKLKQTMGIGLVIIDFLQLMSSTRQVESRQAFVAEVSRSLKVLARELKIPVIALSQLNRAADSRPDHHPVLADLRESGSIEQDADVVMFIYRDDYYNKESEKPGIAEIIVAKQRNGQTGTVELLWDGNCTRFKNLQA